MLSRREGYISENLVHLADFYEENLHRELMIHFEIPVIPNRLVMQC